MSVEAAAPPGISAPAPGGTEGGPELARDSESEAALAVQPPVNVDSLADPGEPGPIDAVHGNEPRPAPPVDDEPAELDGSADQISDAKVQPVAHVENLPPSSGSVDLATAQTPGETTRADHSAAPDASPAAQLAAAPSEPTGDEPDSQPDPAGAMRRMRWGLDTFIIQSGRVGGDLGRALGRVADTGEKLYAAYDDAQNALGALGRAPESVVSGALRGDLDQATSKFTEAVRSGDEFFRNLASARDDIGEAGGLAEKAAETAIRTPGEVATAAITGPPDEDETPGQIPKEK